MNFCLEEVRGRLNDPLGEDKRVAAGYSIDTRTLAPGDLFFAIEGEHFDGHSFVSQALDKGAVAAVVNREKLAPLSGINRENLIAVESTLDALQTLAHAARTRWQGTAIGVTGSVGKTTTKETIAHVLGTKFSTLKSRGNLNNHFGLPLQLLRVEPEQKFAVLEMGMSSPGEIARLAEIARPDWGVVTVVAPVHTEFFADGIDGVARAKRELIEALPSSGIAFLNADDPRVRTFDAHTAARAVLFGRTHEASVRADDVSSLGTEGIAFTLAARGETARVHLPLIGEHNVTNALAAAAIGLEAGMTLAEIANTLATMRPPDNRGQVLEIAGAKVINDCYNSSPRALEAMTDALLKLPGARHIVVAGEMLELGPDSAAMHAACGRYIAQSGATMLVGVRGNARHMVEAAQQAGTEAIFLADADAAGAWLVENLRADDAVLLKASRGVRLEKALEILKQRKEQL